MLDFARDIIFAWGSRTFGDKHMRDKKARALRLVEEAIEVCQAIDVPLEQVKLCADIVYERDRGHPFEELGGVGVTWIASCAAFGYNPETILEVEILRILAIDPAKFAERNREKAGRGLTGHHNCMVCGTPAGILSPIVLKEGEAPKLVCDACIPF